jgi:hypothetical protein
MSVVPFGIEVFVFEVLQLVIYDISMCGEAWLQKI